VPRLWNETIEEHRRAVREATLDAAATLVAGQGAASVTMSQIAERAGIGRATLYKYFSDVDAVLLAWHERQIAAHLDHLRAARDEHESPVDQLHAVLGALALISHQHPDTELAASLHRRPHMARAEHQLTDLVEDLVAGGVASGDLRADVPPAELATFCLHAVTAGARLPGRDATQRLVALTEAALRPPPGSRLPISGTSAPETA
jgi:AcrR family transcriptional regulator